MIILASLIGVGGAAIFIYKQMGNSVNVTKTTPAKARPLIAAETDQVPAPSLTPLTTASTDEHHAATATVADSSEWHFAEFSDKPRFIDVTYDGGRQHARLKVNTVLSSKPDVASAMVSDVPAEDDDRPALEAGNKYITDKRTGRVIGIDGSAGAAMEVRRAEAVSSLPATTIRNPVPEVRVASPVLQFGRSAFDNDGPVQAAAPTTRFPPTRKAQPVYRDEYGNIASPDTGDEAPDDLPVRRALPTRQGASQLPGDQRFPTSDRTYVFGR